MGNRFGRNVPIRVNVESVIECWVGVCFWKVSFFLLLEINQRIILTNVLQFFLCLLFWFDVPFLLFFLFAVFGLSSVLLHILCHNEKLFIV